MKTLFVTPRSDYSRHEQPVSAVVRGQEFLLRLEAEARRGAQRRGDELRVLLRLDAARAVDQRAAGAEAMERGLEQRALLRGQFGQGRVGETPARLHAPAQDAGVRAGRVEQHAVELARMLPREGRAFRLDRRDDPQVQALHVLDQPLEPPRRIVHRGDHAPVLHQLGHVARLAARRGAEVEDVLARLRPDERRDRGAGIVLHLEEPFAEGAQPRHLRSRRQPQRAAGRATGAPPPARREGSR